MKTMKKLTFGVSVLVAFVMWASISYAADGGGSTFSWVTNALSNHLLEGIVGIITFGLYKAIKPLKLWIEEKTGIDIEIKVKERIRNFVNSAKNRLKKSAKSGGWDEMTFEDEVVAEVMKTITSTLPEYLEGRFSESWLKDLVYAIIEEENNKPNITEKKSTK